MSSKPKRIFAFERPDLLKEWDYKKNDLICSPDEIGYKSNKKVWWICPKGHSYDQTVDKRVSRNSTCPICSNKRILTGYNDLKTLNPNLVSEWNYEKNETLSPDTVSLHSNKWAWWKCIFCGHEWKTKINDRANGRGCPVCAKLIRGRSYIESQLNRGINDFKTLFPNIAEEWDDDKNELSPSEYTSSSMYKAWWKCSVCGNGWQATIANRAQKQSGCPKCMKHQRTSFPEQALLFYIKNMNKNINLMKNSLNNIIGSSIISA